MSHNCHNDCTTLLTTLYHHKTNIISNCYNFMLSPITLSNIIHFYWLKHWIKITGSKALWTTKELREWHEMYSIFQSLNLEPIIKIKGNSNIDSFCKDLWSCNLLKTSEGEKKLTSIDFVAIRFNIDLSAEIQVAIIF